MGRIDDLEQELATAYLEYAYKRADEYIKKRLSGRIILDFKQGEMKLFDQPIIMGASNVSFYLDKIA